eukprot:1196388-Prorocentrum_minimum.AAC.3
MGGGTSSFSGSFSPVRSPIARGRRAYTRRRNLSREGGEHIPGAGTHRARAESIYPAPGPVVALRVPTTLKP